MVGIETPLGVVTLSQIEKGEAIIDQLFIIFNAGDQQKQAVNVASLSNAFFTCIPHNVGRSASALASLALNSLEQLAQKQELLQLMRDMLTATMGTSLKTIFSTVGFRFKKILWRHQPPFHFFFLLLIRVCRIQGSQDV